MGLNTTYASGNRANSKLSMSKTSIYIISNIKYSKSNDIDFTLKRLKNLIYVDV